VNLVGRCIMTQVILAITIGAFLGSSGLVRFASGVEKDP
jgi:hypothetical protein